ncbi:hypothetical protein DUZ99_14580 [Xylanibacillus composti]|uniref:Uncharacterized protein n=2 Tax=Xylanibacillus composti TaxID=1572762 RepID=A0A8J4H1W7_9BACL|nr:hypothetical protein [Xylanibacillus composti]MDT9726204.1 hypothetical protein [Xylanibacillus composti]GIQ68050.1 hypothetical protein XYCOK13_08740 [Xylanibacillus composti]
MLLILLIPIISLNYYSTRKSVDVIEKELIHASLNKMELFTVQLDSSIEKFELVSTRLLMDTNVLEYNYNVSLSDYTMLKTRSLIQEKLFIASTSGNWRN